MEIFFFYDIGDSIKEIKKGFLEERAVMSKINLYYGNDLNLKERAVIGLQPYIEIEKRKINIKHGNGKGAGGFHFLTFTNSTIDIIKDVHTYDHSFNMALEKEGIIYHTSKNAAYHLGWDLQNTSRPVTEYALCRQEETEKGVLSGFISLNPLFIPEDICNYKNMI